MADGVDRAPAWSTEGRGHYHSVLFLVMGALGGPYRQREKLENGLKPEASVRKGRGWESFSNPEAPRLSIMQWTGGGKLFVSRATE